jgi:hypothetical protein
MKTYLQLIKSFRSVSFPVGKCLKWKEIREGCWKFLICTATKIHPVDQNNEDDVYGVLACVGEKRITSRISIGQSKRKRQLGRRRNRWNNDIKISLKEKEWGEWIHLAAFYKQGNDT